MTLSLRSLFASFTLSLTLLGAACAEKGASKGASEAAKGSDLHAAKDVKPGSYEDWCGEHSVPESQCTKCNPSLIAAFKASNDWCVEHDLPESHCKKCNPNLKIERPPKGE